MSVVIQRYKKSAIDSTTITLVPSTSADAEGKPKHLGATQAVFTYTATPEEMFGVVAGGAGLTDDQEYEITIRRLG